MPREPVYGKSQAVMDAAMRGELRARLISDRLQMTATEARWRHNLWLVQKSKELGTFYDRIFAENITWFTDRFMRHDRAGWPTRDAAGEQEC